MEGEVLRDEKMARVCSDVPPVGVLAIKPGAEEGTMTNFRADSFG